jgi:hypothetical protein
MQHEYLDQDVSIELKSVGLEENDERVLVQFKYSYSPEKAPIGPKHLKDITTSFRSSIRLADQHGTPVSRCILITNRRIPSIQGGGKRAQLTDTFEDAAPIEGIPVRYVFQLPSEMWRAKLVKFARAYGCLEDEIELGISSLVGDLTVATQAGNNAPLDVTWMARRLTGIQQPSMLDASSILETDEHSFRSAQDSLDLQGEPVRREIADELNREARERALIVLSGPGGVGKSVTAWDWVRTLRLSVAEGTGVTATMRHARSVESNYLPTLVAEWSSDNKRASGRAHESPNQAISRLSVANPRVTHPVLFLCLDGLDERLGIEQIHLVSKILEWFWEEDKACRSQARAPRATLVVTCRDRDQIERELLPLRMSRFSQQELDRPKHLPMDDFTWRELVNASRLAAPQLTAVIERAASQAGPQEPRRAVNGAMGLSTSESPIPQGVTDFSALPGVELALMPADVEALESLLHPVVWRALLTLEGALREQFILGHQETMDRVAYLVLQRFCDKAAVRGLHREVSEIMAALRPLAQHCIERKQQVYDQAVWCEYVRQSGVMVHPQDSELLKEAHSAGLIKLEATSRWRWRHRFICAYIASSTADDIPSSTGGTVSAAYGGGASHDL